MRHDARANVSASKKLLLATAAVVTLALPVAVGVLNAPRLRAQAVAGGAIDPAFEVASVKPSKSGDGPSGIRFAPGGRLNITNQPLQRIIAAAYGEAIPLAEFRVIGGPKWTTSDQFDIIAKADGDPPPSAAGPPPMMFAMLRTLLADRFKLVVHHETQEMPIYGLVLARNDGKLGPQLRRSEVDCAALRAARGNGPPSGPPPPGTAPFCGIQGGPGRLRASSIGLSAFAFVLAARVNRVVMDKTGLSGNFDFDLEWTPDQSMSGADGRGGLGRDAFPGALPPPPADGPSIYTAVQEQLGLKLESQKGPVDVLVIDHVEQPTPD